MHYRIEHSPQYSEFAAMAEWGCTPAQWTRLHREDRILMTAYKRAHYLIKLMYEHDEHERQAKEAERKAKMKRR